jgi:hypothetical protein
MRENSRKITDMFPFRYSRSFRAIHLRRALTQIATQHGLALEATHRQVFGGFSASDLLRFINDDMNPLTASDLQRKRTLYLSRYMYTRLAKPVRLTVNSYSNLDKSISLTAWRSKANLFPVLGIDVWTRRPLPFFGGRVEIASTDAVITEKISNDIRRLFSLPPLDLRRTGKTGQTGKTTEKRG